MAVVWCGLKRSLRTGIVLVLLALPGTPGRTGDAWAQSATGDLQWAQTILNEKGYAVGRANGQMTPKTKSALAAYQKSVGLPASGELDSATIAKMMASRSAPSSQRMLTTPEASRAKRQAGPEPKPEAAPAVRVDAAGGSGDQIIGAIGRPSGGNAGSGNAGSGNGAPAAASHLLGPASFPAMVPGMAPPRGGDHPAPVAAPRTAVTAEGRGDTPASGTDTVAADTPFRLEAPVWVHAGIAGFVVMLAGFVGWWWWSSGRPPARHEQDWDADDRPVTRRREPTLSMTRRGGR